MTHQSSPVSYFTVYNLLDSKKSNKCIITLEAEAKEAGEQEAGEQEAGEQEAGEQEAGE